MADAFADFHALQAQLDRLGLFHMDLTLGRMEGFFRASGLAEPPFPVVHVVGTNGKGSTTAFLEALLLRAGLRVGVYTSPHFLSVRERVRLDGAPASPEAFLAAANRIAPLAGELTYFEFLTALAVDAFAAHPVDVAVMEAGLGGKYDAVSALERDLLLYTPIDLDHAAQLGHTRAAVASDKAGAMRPGLPALTVPQHPEARAVLEEAAAGTGCPLETAAVMDFGRDSLGLAGPHQSVNASLALGAADRLVHSHGWDLPLDERLPAMHRAFLPGRLQWAQGQASGADLILDAAHNAHSLAALGDALDDLDIHPAAVVFSCFSDKDLSSLAPHVARLTRGPILVPPIPAACRGRACDPRSIAGALTPRARVADDPEAAVREAARHGSPVLACGSLYLLAALYTQRPHLLAPPTNPAEVRP